MKRVGIVFLFICLFATVIVGCIFSYFYFTKEEKSNNTIKESTEEIAEEISAEPIFTVEDYPRFDASLATQPLATAFLSDFTRVDMKSEEIEYSNTHPAYLKLIDGEVDLIIVTEPSEEELAIATENGIELEVIPVVKEGFVFFVNERNPVQSLTLEEVQKIYMGEIINWNEVGGKDIAIRPFQRNTNSGSQTRYVGFGDERQTVNDSTQRRYY